MKRKVYPIHTPHDNTLINKWGMTWLHMKRIMGNDLYMVHENYYGEQFVYGTWNYDGEWSVYDARKGLSVCMWCIKVIMVNYFYMVHTNYDGK